MSIEVPSFSSLPLDKKGPRGNAWGRFGKNDNLGMLNLITPETVVEAAKEIKTGIRVSLDWTLNMPTHPSFGRQIFDHKIIDKAPRTVNDDVLSFNTQCSTQWDGLRHFGYQDTKQFYNGVTEDLIKTSDALSTHHVVERGGITGRGVLLDYAAYAKKNNIPIEHFESTSIKLEHLKAIVQEKNLVLRQGDILFIRTGWVPAYEALDVQAREELPKRPEPDFVGVEATREVLEWLWSIQPAAVAGDQVGFEQCPLQGKHHDPEHILHEWLIAGWGMPIGEMFNLEALARECERQGRYTFFVSSMHLKVPGGVASPPNAVAIF